MRAPGIWQSLLLSLWTGLAATALSLCLAHVALAVVATSAWKDRLRMLTLPLLASPHLALAIGLVLLVAPSGLLMRTVSPWATGFAQPPDWATVQDAAGFALIGGLVIKETPFLLLVLGGARAQVDTAPLLLQARLLGYGRLKAWLVVVAPLLQRQIRFGMAAVLVFGITNVEMALPLGPTSPPPLSIRLLQWFSQADLALRGQAYAGTLLLLGASIVGLLAAAAVGSAARALWRRSADNGHRRRRDATAVRGIVFALGLLLSVGTLALLALLLRTAGGAWRFPRLLPAPLSLDAWRNVAPDLGAALTTTVTLGVLTSIVCVALVLVVAEKVHRSPGARRRIGSLLFIPLLLPQFAFLFGWQVLLARLHLDGTLLAVVWSHCVFALPYVWSVLAEARAALEPGYELTAQTLGAGRLRTWWMITAPLLSRSILLAFALAFSVSAAIYLPTLFAGGGRVVTLATEAAAAVSSGNIRSAAASGSAQALLPMASFICALWLGQLLFRNRRGVPA